MPVVDARRKWHGSPWALWLAFAAALGCGSPEHSPAAGSSGSSSTGGVGGTSTDLPTGGTAGVGGSSGAGTQPIVDGGATGGDAGETSDGGLPPVDDTPPDGGGDGGGGDAGVAVWSCDGDYAYGSSATITFTDPTPSALSSALTAISGATHPISLVLHLEEGFLFGALSATTEDDGGKHVFLPDHVPTLEPLVEAFGSPPGVTTVDAQPDATLHFEDEEGPLDIQIEHVVWRATQNSSCADMTVSMQAVIPTSQFSLVVHLPTGDQTIEELVASDSSGPPPIGGGEPTPIPVEIAATFQGVPLDFDFDTL